MPAEIYLNVAVSGLLTGLVYGLMALGLSVIFGVVRVVNFAHGEMMTIAMYLAVFLFAAFKLDPLVMLVPISMALFALGYAMQAGLINPFINRPEHSQFMLLVAVAIIMVNVLLDRLRAGRQECADVLLVRQLPDRPADRRRHQGLCRRRRHRGRARAVRVLPLHADRQGDPRLRRQLHRRAGRRPQRQAALCADLRDWRRLRRRRRFDHGAAWSM